MKTFWHIVLLLGLIWIAYLFWIAPIFGVIQLALIGIAILLRVFPILQWALIGFLFGLRR